jgi:hypothetical protein
MAVIRTEPFTAANGTNLTTLNFTANQGAWQVNTNEACSNSAATETGTRDVANSYPADQYSQGAVTAINSGNYVGVSVRCDTGGAVTWYGLYSDSLSDLSLYKEVAGTWTSIATTATTAVVSDVLRLEVQGTSLRAYKNGSILFGGAQTDSAISTGRAGLAGYGNSTGCRIDNLETGDLGFIPRMTLLGVG